MDARNLLFHPRAEYPQCPASGRGIGGFDLAHEDPKVGVIILTGEGEKAEFYVAQLQAHQLSSTLEKAV